MRPSDCVDTSDTQLVEMWAAEDEFTANPDSPNHSNDNDGPKSTSSSKSDDSLLHAGRNKRQRSISSPGLAQDSIEAIDNGDKPVKPKQKRNKPTLSCLECVERKTKCDRGRPCLACVKRQSSCEYTAVANLIASTNADCKNNSASTKARYVTKTTNRTRKSSMIDTLSARSPTDTATVRDHGNSQWLKVPAAASPLYSDVLYTKSSPSNVFGVGSQHPFSNYWTCQGGLPEVISVLPSKEQADILIAKYFETVDPVVPFLHRQSFYVDYERFWSSSQDAKNETDASLMALHYAMYALGTQFMDFPSYEERSQTAEFYCSAANQALRVYSYLNRTSMRAIQAMLLMTYFLMNDNHASDAYAWAGIHLRQAYAMRLHRDPDIIVPDASVLEKQARRKLWQAVFFQDTFFTILLKLPPTATHSDVPVESLTDENEVSMDGFDSCLHTHSRVENLMSINVIAPQSCGPLPPPMPHHLVNVATMKSDVTYLRCTWHLGNLVQENLSSPYSLSLPLCNSTRHRDSLVAAFKRLYKTFPSHLTTQDPVVLQQQSALYPRQVKQNLFLMSNYHHCLMLLYGAENRKQGIGPDVRCALESAHEALWTFFNLWTLFQNEASVWWLFQHRAFEESLLIAHFLATVPDEERAPATNKGSIYDKAKDDVSHMLAIMEQYGSQLEIHKSRKRVLYEAFACIAI